jgi:hypothetical protein
VTCVTVIVAVPDEAAVNVRDAPPPGVNWPVNVSVTGDVEGDVAVVVSLPQAAAPSAAPKSRKAANGRAVMCA